MTLDQSTINVLTLLATLLAVWVAYLAVSKGSEPQLLAFYQPNPGVPSFIDLVIENAGTASALDVVLSAPIPIDCFGIEKPDKKPGSLPVKSFPSIAPGQRFIFNGGQYAGLDSQLGDGLSVKLSYNYRNVIGLSRKGSETFVLSVKHLGRMPSRTSAEEAIVDALKGPNKTTIQEIRNELKGVSQQLARIAQHMEDKSKKE